MADKNEQHPLSTRDVLEAAYDANEQHEGEAPASLKPADVEPGDPGEADKASLGGSDRAVEVPEGEEKPAKAPEAKAPGRGPDGKFVAKQPEAQDAPAEKGGPAAPATPQAQPTAAVPPPAAAAAPASRAPQSWKPAAREVWSKLPREAQEEVTRLERERESILRSSAETRRFVEDFQRTVSPYAQHIARAGSTPMQAVQNMMQTAAALEGPNKAAVVWQVMQTYGITPEALADVIDGQPGATHAAPAQAQDFRDPRVDQMLWQQRQQQEAQAQAAAARADAELAEFSRNHEFVNDVLPEMLDFFEVAAKRGLAMDWETAYNRSIALRPDLTEILRQREAAAAAASPNGPTQRAVLASSSVRGTPGRKPKAAPMDTREALEAAWDKLSGDGGRV